MQEKRQRYCGGVAQEASGDTNKQNKGVAERSARTPSGDTRKHIFIDKHDP